MTRTSAAQESHPLAALFRPAAVAIVGATEKSAWTAVIVDSMRGFGVRTKMYAVNLSGAPAFGMPGYQSCTAIPGGVDAAYLCVPQDAVPAALDDVAAAGTRNVVVLTSGYAEAGPEGARKERELSAQADRHDIRMLGPNCMGFANLAAGAALTSINPRGTVLPAGRVGFVSQSGATAVEILEFTQQQGVAVSFFAATGNEARISLADVVDYLVDDPATRVIMVFAETIRNPRVFAAAAQRALRAAKPIVVLKVGSSEISASVARAHTGSLVGDDRIFSAVCEQLGVIRVHSVEDLVITAAFLAHSGPLAPGGLGVASISGGACTLVGDMAEVAGVPLPPFGDGTVASLRAVLPSYAATHNPLDITGAAVRDPTIFERALGIISDDPGIAVRLAVLNLPHTEGATTPTPQMLTAVGNGLRAGSTPGFLAVQTLKPVTDLSRRVMRDCNVPAVTGGLAHAVRATGRALWWSHEQRTGRERTVSKSAMACRLSPQSRATESDVLGHLQDFGVGVIPFGIADSADEAAALARQFGGRTVLKISSADIAHKTEVGGVKLRLEGDEAVARAYDEIMASVRTAAPNARIEGVLVAPMRERGLELFVGTSRDADWGTVIAVGLGGIWIEALRDTAVRVLPIDRADVVAMFNSLRAAPILKGFRGMPAVDIESVADHVVKFAEAATALGPSLSSLEINPLLVDGSRVEAIDALVAWS